jgi:tRNA(fMet)-specific endonuclease VapC
VSGSLLLDTSAILDLFAGVDAVTRLLAEATEAFVPIIATGELLYGARVSSRSESNLADVEGFAAASASLPCDVETARHYAKIRASLRFRGRPIPENDLWVAALAKQHGLTLAARDHHFREVEGLSLVEW